jgi:hypothetical protein
MASPVDDFPKSFFRPEKSESLTTTTTLTQPYTPPDAIDPKVAPELDPSGRIPAGETLRRDLYYVCQFMRPAPDTVPDYDEGDGCFIWRMRYDCSLREDLVWVRRRPRDPLVLAFKTRPVFAIIKYVRLCGRRTTVLDKWEADVGEYDPGKDTHAGEHLSGDPDAEDWRDKWSQPTEQKGSAPPPGPGTAPGGLVRDPDLPEHWVTEPRPATPPLPPPKKHPAPPLFTPPARGEITSADAGRDSAGNLIEKRRYWKLGPVRLGPERCIEHATYTYWEETWLHDANGGNALIKSEPFQPGRSETVAIRIPGCE